MEKFKFEEIEQFQEFIIRYCIETEKVCKGISLTKSEYKSNVILFNYLERFLFGWRALNKLIDKNSETINPVFPIPIIARAIVHDLIMVLYLGSQIKVNPNNSKDRKEENLILTVKDLDTDFVKAMFKILEQSIGDTEELRKEKVNIKQTIDNYYNDLCIEKDGDIVVKKGNRIIIDTIYKDIELKNVGKALYLQFKYLSQFEHFSPMTKAFLYKHPRINFSHIVETLSYTLYASDFIVTLFDNENYSREPFKELQKKIESYIGKYKIDFGE